MTIRLELLDFLNALQNQVQLFEIEPETSEFEDHPEIIEKMKMTIAVLERIYPMIQPIDEVLLGDITPKLFYAKWKQVKGFWDFPEADGDIEIGSDVKNLLDRFGSEGENA